MSPLRAGGYKEFWDGRFLLELGFPELHGKLSEWWPAGGPHWDALARLEFSEGVAGVLLVEGKSYPEEMRDKKGLSATSPASIEKIEQALDETQRWLNVDKPLEAWLRPYYQTANRLAMLYWLRRQLGDDRAWLVHLCFLNDPTHVKSTREQWLQAFQLADKHLGLHRPVPNYAHIFLQGLSVPSVGAHRALRPTVSPTPSASSRRARQAGSGGRRLRHAKVQRDEAIRSCPSSGRGAMFADARKHFGWE